MSQANVYTSECRYDEADPDGYRCATAKVGAAAGGKADTVKVYEIPPEQSLCPYHYEYEEEWLVVLDGELALRSPDGETILDRGALVCFPPGPEGAHQVTNRATKTARIMMWSSSREPAVAVYPDSDKIGVWAGADIDGFMFHRRDGGVAYYEGELRR